MPGQTRKYNKEKDAELKMRVVDVLNSAKDSDLPTLDWIKTQDPMGLGSHSTQKLSRILGSLAEIGLVQKGKAKSLNRMVYRLTSRMIEDGYEVEHQQRAWYGREWDLEDEIVLQEDNKE